MTRGVGEGDPRLLRPLALLDVEVCPAKTGGPDPHNHVERPDGLGLIDVVELERLVVGVQSRGLHLATSSGSAASLWRNCSNERQMPPLASRLVRTSRAIRSQRVNSPAISCSPLGSTNAGAQASNPIP